MAVKRSLLATTTMKGRNVIRMLTLIAVMSWAAASPAEPTIAMVKPVTSFGYLDTDKDARVSPAEAKADWAVAQQFAGADLNKDGYLDKSEFAALNRG